MRIAKKVSTELRHSTQVIHALNLIWHNPDKELNLENVSQACNVSKYHFHRIFHEHQSESLSSYIARKRLERAANRLVLFSNCSILQIAASLGYSSPSNFAKAFKRYFGISANEFRHPNQIDSIPEGVIKSKYGKELNPILPYSRYQFLPKYEQEIRLKELDEVISFVRSEEQTLMYQTIHNGLGITSWLPLWDKICSWTECNGLDLENNAFGVWYDNMFVCPNELIRHDAAIRVPKSFEIPQPFMKQTMEAGIYATGTLTGKPYELQDALRDIYMFWFKNRKYVPDLKPYYEQYLNNALEDGYYIIRFFIKIKSKQRS